MWPMPVYRCNKRVGEGKKDRLVQADKQLAIDSSTCECYGSTATEVLLGRLAATFFWIGRTLNLRQKTNTTARQDTHHFRVFVLIFNNSPLLTSLINHVYATSLAS